jgi:DNA-binding MarR family transcriptional regulator
MDRLSETERRAVIRELFQSFSDRLGVIAASSNGALTLNSLRVRAAITIAVLGGEKVTSSDVARTLDLNNTTVHRIITTLIEEGRIKESSDPDDGRKRILGFTEFQWGHFAEMANSWVTMTLEGISRDTAVLTKHDLMSAPAQDTVAELVLQIRRDGTLSVSGFDLPAALTSDS